jgi:hypothetical protein
MTQKMNEQTPARPARDQDSRAAAGYRGTALL